jgi:hypothetical protein
MKEERRPEVLESGPLHYAPENEQGVVFLFAHLARKFRMRIDRIKQGFPDCIAYEKLSGVERKVRIEFEYKSRAFSIHRHPVNGCDCIVCWEHDWPECPRTIRVIELRRHFGLGFKVWLQPATAPQVHHLDKNRVCWAARNGAHVGDLMVMYRCLPEKCVRELFWLATPLRSGRCDPAWRDGTCMAGEFRIVCRLSSPVFLEDLKSHRVLRTAGFVRGRLQGNRDVTSYWPHIYDLITSRNPSVRKQLKEFSPEQLDMR